MKKLYLIAILLLAFGSVQAQTTDTDPKDTTIYNHVDKQPEFPGGMKAVSDFVKKNLKPGDDKGLVYAVFDVEKDGSISHIKVIKHLSDTADKESVRLIKTFPKFSPAVKDNKTVRCSFTFPIMFRQD